MFKRVFAIAAVTGLVLLPMASAPAPAFADGDRDRHGAHKGYRHRDHHRHYGHRHSWHYGRYRHHPSYRYYHYDPYYYRYGRYHYGPPGCWYGAPRNVVQVRCYDFAPRRLHIPVGAAAVWWFDDYGVPHTVTADDGSLDSGPRRAGEFRVVFGRPGLFRYHCAIHPYMTGTVVVG